MQKQEHQAAADAAEAIAAIFKGEPGTLLIRTWDHPPHYSLLNVMFASTTEKGHEAAALN